jgi:hypothetical protein
VTSDLLPYSTANAAMQRYKDEDDDGIGEMAQAGQRSDKEESESDKEESERDKGESRGEDVNTGLT